MMQYDTTENIGYTHFFILSYVHVNVYQLYIMSFHALGQGAMTLYFDRESSVH